MSSLGVKKVGYSGSKSISVSAATPAAAPEPTPAPEVVANPEPTPEVVAEPKPIPVVEEKAEAEQPSPIEANNEASTESAPSAVMKFPCLFDALGFEYDYGRNHCSRRSP